jgi:hypothetical protein
MYTSNILPFSPLGGNLIFSLTIFYLAYHWMLKPVLHSLKPIHVLTPILLLHAMRHLGVMFVSPGVVSPDIPWQFAWPASAGDFIAASLAMVAVSLLQRKSSRAIAALWVFNVFGSLDLASSIILSRIFQTTNFLGAAYWIPIFWVPMLIVGHMIVFKVLAMHRRGEVEI